METGRFDSMLFRCYSFRYKLKRQNCTKVLITSSIVCTWTWTWKHQVKCLKLLQLDWIKLYWNKFVSKQSETRVTNSKISSADVIIQAIIHVDIAFGIDFHLVMTRSHCLQLSTPNVMCLMFFQIERIKISFDGGKTSMNFAEAALLIQGSACIYSKKV